MFDLRSISSVAPPGDIVFGVVIMLIAVTFANLTILPKLFSRSKHAAIALLMVTVLGVVCIFTVLAASPPMIFLTIISYAAIFALVGIAVSWGPIGWLQSLARVGGGVACVLVSVVIAQMVAYAPR